MNENQYLVIMAGGIGSRFWPMSRTSYPKQFLDVLGLGRTLIQQTYDRFKEIVSPENVFVVANEKYKSLIWDQLPEIPLVNILSEPSGRNTAPCMAYAGFHINQLNPAAQIIVAPSDHLITDPQEFTRCINIALKACKKQDIFMTLGIKPSRPDTGYGYIQLTRKNSEQQEDFYKVKTFTEKPSYEIAVSFLESGDFVWNSGIFISSLKTLLEGIRTHLPDMYELFAENKNFFATPKEQEKIKDIYSRCKNISIDYGVMERASNVFVISSDFGWSDLGTWSSLYTHMEKKENENAIIGKVYTYDSNRNLIRFNDNKLIVVEGLDDFIVVDTPDVLLICRKSSEQKIKEIVADIKKFEGEDYI
jgi:mannose-1-phosphate guanylyltransferase